MAGLTENIQQAQNINTVAQNAETDPSPGPSSTVDAQGALVNAQNQVASLDAAQKEIKGVGDATLRELFSYDQALADRYSAPDSKMYIENASKRYDVMGGWNKLGQSHVTSVFDMLTKVQSMKEDLNKTIQDLKDEMAAQAKKSGSGSGGIAVSDLASLLGLDGEQDTEIEATTPTQTGKTVRRVGQNGVTRQSLMADIKKQFPGQQLDYTYNKDGTISYSIRKEDQEFVDKGRAIEIEKKKAARQQVYEMYGVNENQIRTLSAYAAFDPKGADKALNSLISNNVTSNLKGETEEELVTKIKNGAFAGKNRQEAISFIKAKQKTSQFSTYDYDYLLGVTNSWYDSKEKDSPPKIQFKK